MSAPPSDAQVRRFEQEHDLPTEPEATYDSIAAHLLPGLERHGYVVVRAERGSELVLEPGRPAGWRTLVATTFPPLGLLAVGTQRVHVTLRAHGDGGTRMSVRGRAPLAVRRALQGISGPG